MVTVMSLWLPVLVSAVAVFFVSWLIHMVLKYHKNDFKAVPDETGLMDAVRKFNIAPGDYCVPRARGMEDMKDPAFIEKWNKGPVFLMTIYPPGPFSMGKSLTLWFIYCVVMSVFAAYVAGRTVPAGSAYLAVFRVAGTVAFAGYALALWQTWIWYKRGIGTVIKQNIDGLVYGLVTGGVFGWLWPGM